MFIFAPLSTVFFPPIPPPSPPGADGYMLVYDKLHKINLEFQQGKIIAHLPGIFFLWNKMLSTDVSI